MVRLTEEAFFFAPADAYECKIIHSGTMNYIDNFSPAAYGPLWHELKINKKSFLTPMDVMKPQTQ